MLSTLLAAIAEFECELIRERTGEGRKRAMANGVKFGRKPKLSPYQRAEAIKRRPEKIKPRYADAASFRAMAVTIAGLPGLGLIIGSGLSFGAEQVGEGQACCAEHARLDEITARQL